MKLSVFLFGQMLEAFYFSHDHPIKIEYKIAPIFPSAGISKITDDW